MSTDALTETKKAYSEILKVMNKYRELCNFNISNFERISKLHLFGIELKDVHGFDINPKNINSLDWVDLGYYTKVALMGEKYNRKISWPDNGVQPDDELLLIISFATGAYIFGDDYPTEFFQKFFLELVNLKPKYTDFHNKSLFFSMENAGNAFNQFNVLYKKYNELNKEDRLKREITRMENAIEKLKETK